MMVKTPTIFKTKDGQIVLIRPHVPSDAPALIELLKNIAHETTHTLQYVGKPELSLDEVARRIEEKSKNIKNLNLGVFKKENDDKKEVMIGNLFFHLPYGDHPWMLHVGYFGMMILKQYWGQGIAKELLRLQDEHARSIGVRRIEAMVRVNNERGVGLYQHCGFEIEGRRKEVALIQGKYEDEYFIAKTLL